jgi:gluconate 2-dehydrogenase subunit 3-like protein
MDRRDTLKWIVAASASPMLQRTALGGGQAASAPALRSNSGEGAGYGSDPDLLKRYKAGDVWPLVLTAAQRRAATALSDVIIPADDRSPSASAVGVVDFLDEWLSAPYPRQQHDRSVVVEGLGWLDSESNRRFGADFAAASASNQVVLCDDICDPSRAKDAFARPAVFFARFRDLTAGGFYTTPVGIRDVGYLGNVPQVKFEGPPQDLLRKLGLIA